MTPDTLKSLCERATPGPWYIDYDHRDGGSDQIVETRSGKTLTIAFGTSNGNENDFPLAVAAVNALPSILKLWEAIEAYQARPSGKWQSVADALSELEAL